LNRKKLQPGKDENTSEPQPKDASGQPAISKLNGAAIIDEDGREVPITESMIDDAFGKIENSGKSQ
jgi:hypothetical protein